VTDDDGRGATSDAAAVPNWEPEAGVDRLTVRTYRALAGLGRVGLIVVATVLGLVQVAIAGVAVRSRPSLAGLFLLSFVPAFTVAWIVYRRDAVREPLGLLAGTAILGALFSTFAGVSNTVGLFALVEAFPTVSDPGAAAQTTTGFAAFSLFMFLFVGPVEEFVKWLAVRLLSFRSEWFDSALDGAVYGAMAGLGFAAAENLQYVAGVGLQGGPFVAVLDTAVTRAFVGPNHVLWAAISGYYLGLAKRYPQFRGPLVLKGLLVAAFLHGFFNVTVGLFVTGFDRLTGSGQRLALAVYVVGFAAVVSVYLARTLSRHQAVDAGVERERERRSSRPRRRE